MQVGEKIIVCTPDGLKRRKALILFGTGGRATCVSEKVGEELGFLPYKEPMRIPLAVKKREAEVMDTSSSKIYNRSNFTSTD